MKSIIVVLALLLIVAGCTQNNTQLEDLRNQVSTLQTTVNTNQQEKATLQATISSQQQQITALQSQMQDLQNLLASSRNNENKSVSDCMSYLQTNVTGYLRGEIEIGVYHIDIDQVIKDYGLQKKSGNLKTAMVTVPVGREIEYVCKLKEDPRLEYAKLSRIVSLS